LAKPRFLLVYPLVAWLCASARTTENELRVGIVLAVLGLAVRLWANGYVGCHKVNVSRGRGDAKIGRLVTSGPYAFVRHPLYFGSFLLGAGACVIAGDVIAGVVALAGFLIVYDRKMAQEEALLLEEVGATYRLYQAAVPRWLPTWRRYPYRSGRWSWRGVVASREWKTVIWTLVLILAWYAREEALQREWFMPGRQFKHAVILSAMVALAATDGIMELIRRTGRQRSAAPMPACAEESLAA
jgi:protein-S-isoprenylcysteine O-methyltransferase Ste14